VSILESEREREREGGGEREKDAGVVKEVGVGSSGFDCKEELIVTEI